MLKVLVVDDYEPFRRVVRSIFQPRNDLQIVGEASDGLEAVQKAKVLQPDLILLDIDLPTLRGFRLEQLCSNLANTHEFDILCAYPFRGFQDEKTGALSNRSALNTPQCIPG